MSRRGLPVSFYEAPEEEAMVPLPTAAEAEEIVAACAAANAWAARLLAAKLHARDFHEPWCRRVFEVSTDPRVAAAEAAAPPGDREAARLDVIAELAGVDRERLGRAAADRPVMADRSGKYAGAVSDAARWRGWMEWACDLYQAAAHRDSDRLEALLDDVRGATADAA